MNDKEQENFRKRFTEIDWGWLCTVDEFKYALKNGTRKDAAILAALLLETRRMHGSVSKKKETPEPTGPWAIQDDYI